MPCTPTAVADGFFSVVPPAAHVKPAQAPASEPDGDVNFMRPPEAALSEPA
jgi:hypothetical protein